MDKLRIGIAGAGIGSLQVIPNLLELKDRVVLTAIADTRRDNMAYYAECYGAPVKLFDSVEEMCQSNSIDAVWVATPNEFHAAHVIAAANAKKHVICEKPMAVTLDQCRSMVAAVERNGIKYVQGHSKVYDSPVRKLGEIARSGELGRVIHIQSLNWNDWLIRALMPQEVDTELGTGVVFRQGPHQIDTVRFIAGGMARSVRAIAGRHEPNFPRCEGNYTAFIEFEGGIAANLMFDGYGYLDVTEFTWGIGEAGKRHRNPDSIVPRARPSGPVTAEQKYALVRAGNPYGYGAGGGWLPDAPQQQPFFGLTIVSCERGVMRVSPDGLFVYDKTGRREVLCPQTPHRAAELVELYDALKYGRPTLLDAHWGMATTEVCLAILQSSRERREIALGHQSVAPRFEPLAS
jgi:phthalate 4,5-cis-dihydrodiol dehydrogenase